MIVDVKREAEISLHDVYDYFSVNKLRLGEVELLHLVSFAHIELLKLVVVYNLLYFWICWIILLRSEVFLATVALRKSLEILQESEQSRKMSMNALS